MWIDRVWSSKECVCYVYDHNVYLDVPSIGFVCCMHSETY